MKISKQDAKTIALSSQLLTNNNDNVLDIIEHLGYIQIDTISVISRAHHHVLWTRFDNYDESIINKLLEKDKSIFEYWSHAASYLPIKDFRYSLFQKKAYSLGKNHWFEQNSDIKKYVLDRIKSEGALQSKDFEHTNKVSEGWYDWKPAKKALEQLFMEGQLMVAKRKGFQKVYDLTERVLPNNIDTSEPTIQEYCRYLIETSIRSHGIVHESEISYLRGNIKSTIKHELNELEKDNKIIKIKIEDFDNLGFFTTEDNLDCINKVKNKKIVHFLSPFDNLIIQRKRVQRIFDFDYLIECYVPEPKRKYGYFCLPILFDGNLVGRFDPKADRKNKIFYINSIHFEDSFIITDEFNNLFKRKIDQLAKFNGCENVVYL